MNILCFQKNVHPPLNNVFNISGIFDKDTGHHPSINQSSLVILNKKKNYVIPVLNMKIILSST